ncbi:MAG: SDR family oxidoreductase [Dehalococcoidia bacterium]|nr:SDR family oxidoreductase [Dehalococcoidia bacterium]
MAALEGMYALVTGGGSGIGLATAKRLRDDGAVVTLMGRSKEKLEAARAELLATPGPEVRVAAGDVANEADVEAAVAAACDAQGRLQGCVAAAGTGTFGPALDTDRAAWDTVIATNLTGAMLTLKHAGRAMVRAGGGSIVGISSIAGHLTHRWMTTYCVSKAGLEMLMRNAADELGGAGIRVNVVRPGLVPTDLAFGLTSNDGAVADYLDQMPLRRLGTVEDIANLVRYFIGPESSWVTGQVVNADGGHSVRRGPDLDHMAAAFGATQSRPWPGAG